MAAEKCATERALRLPALQRWECPCLECPRVLRVRAPRAGRLGAVLEMPRLGPSWTAGLSGGGEGPDDDDDGWGADGPGRPGAGPRGAKRKWAWGDGARCAGLWAEGVRGVRGVM